MYIHTGIYNILHLLWTLIIFLHILLHLLLVEVPVSFKWEAKCSTTDEWIEKMWHLYTMEFYSATKKNEYLSLAGNCMELDHIISHES
jgi:hypothetical protein